MCYAFELEYYRKMEQARKALEDQQRKEQQANERSGAALPAKPAEGERRDQEAPVPV